MEKLTIMGSLLTEADATAPVRYPVKVIQPGWGSSGYYSEAVLQAAAHMFEGAQMFWNHPKSSDNYERPERDLRDLAGVLMNTHYEETNASGAGVYGEAIVFEPFRETLDEIAPYIGVSIRAGGKVHEGEAEGRAGYLVDSIDLVQSVDFVTRAGAGGKVLTRFAEAARVPDDLNESNGNNPKEDDMELQEALDTINEQKTTIADLRKQMEESASALKEANEQLARVNEQRIIAESVKITREALEGSGLPRVTQKRILAEAEKGSFAVTTDDEKPALDKDATEKAVQEAVSAEKEYLSQLGGTINITGMGKDPLSESDDNDIDLTSVFASMGLSESAAKIAANGR